MDSSSSNFFQVQNDATVPFGQLCRLFDKMVKAKSK